MLLIPGAELALLFHFYVRAKITGSWDRTVILISSIDRPNGSRWHPYAKLLKLGLKTGWFTRDCKSSHQSGGFDSSCSPTFRLRLTDENFCSHAIGKQKIAIFNIIPHRHAGSRKVLRLSPKSARGLGMRRRRQAATKSAQPTCYDEILRIGIHTSSQGTLEKTALKAHELGANTFQIFSASPRMWRASPPDPADVTLLARQRLKLDLKPLVIHDNYLINLASIDPTIRSKSILCFRGELERAAAIGAEYLVAHPGSYRVKRSRKELSISCMASSKRCKGLFWEISRCSSNAPRAEDATSAPASKSCTRFATSPPASPACPSDSVSTPAICSRPAMTSAARSGLDKTIRDADRILGMKNVKLIHANDSKTPLGSRVDRHENIGQGHIGEDGFRRILAHPKLKRLPFILETPVDQEGDDVRNLETLKKLCPKSTTITTKSN